MSKSEEEKRYYLNSYGNLIYFVASSVYFIWYVWNYFFPSNANFKDGGTEGILIILFWVSLIAVMGFIYTFTQGPQFLKPPKFDGYDLFALLAMSLAWYLFIGMIYEDYL